ncbi:hypothetical protein [Aquabacterium sp.]|uniref:hypothetical protein n=1 Tax=Aquabacterium sp. TaxID=1872578 RepID=UPI0025C636A1|nr:hypothetical protein [Aquabacterium sp.]
MRADDMASSAGVGPVFVMDVERGKPTVQLGKVMQLLKEAGIELVVELPQDIAEQAKRSASKGANSARVQSLLSAMFSRRSNKA